MHMTEDIVVVLSACLRRMAADGTVGLMQLERWWWVASRSGQAWWRGQRLEALTLALGSHHRLTKLLHSDGDLDSFANRMNAHLFERLMVHIQQDRACNIVLGEESSMVGALVLREPSFHLRRVP